MLATKRAQDGRYLPLPTGDPNGARDVFERFKIQPNHTSPCRIGYFNTILTIKSQANISARPTPADLRQFVRSKDVPAAGNQGGRFDGPDAHQCNGDRTEHVIDP